MNKLYTISILFLLLSISSKAQDLEVGVKGGLSLVDVGVVSIPGIDTENQYYKMRPSYHVGAFGTVDLSKKFYLQAELLYVNKGFRYDDSRGSDSNIHLHYLTLPVLLNYRILEKLHVGVGGELGYRLAARSKFDNKTINVNWLYERKLDLGIDVCVKYKINEHLNVGVRYNYGLFNIYGERGFITDSNGDKGDKLPVYQNRELQFSVGYIL